MRTYILENIKRFNFLKREIHKNVKLFNAHGNFITAPLILSKIFKYIIYMLKLLIKSGNLYSYTTPGIFFKI